MTTSKEDASKASKLLSNKRTPANVRSVAASDLAQARKPARKSSSRSATRRIRSR